MLLLHDAGRSSADWLPIVNHLTTRRRVVSMDMRGHGRSSVGRWSVDTLLGDIETVLDHYGLSDVTVVGHSLGGVLAHLYALRFPRVSYVVNLDGFALHANEYAGLTPAEAIEFRARAEREWDWTSPTLSAAEVDAEVESVARSHRLSLSVAREIVQRRLTLGFDGSYAQTGDLITLRGVQALYHHFLVERSFFAAIRATPARCLIFHSAVGEPPPQFPCWQRMLADAYNAGIGEQIAQLGSLEMFAVSARTSGHMMLLEEPGELAAEIAQCGNGA